jgi:hypothetical protein
MGEVRPEERDPEEDEIKLEYLRLAIQQGIDSGVAEGDPFARLRERIRKRTRE